MNEIKVAILQSNYIPWKGVFDLIKMDDIVVTFVGTFHPCHGIEVLVAAICKMIDRYENVKFLFVGSGLKVSIITDKLQPYIEQNRVILTGIIPQLETPEYLATSDILVSPQIPNADGTPFFGSPTKLFEYMAMGKAIVASSLDQMGRILTHKETAYLFEPGNVDELTKGLITVINDEDLRKKMGSNARKVVLEKYTWKKHVEKIMEKLTNSALIEK